MQIAFLSEYLDSKGNQHYIEDEIDSSEIEQSDLNLLIRFGAVKSVSRADAQSLKDLLGQNKGPEKASNPSALISVNTGTDAELESVGFGAAAIRRIKGKRPYMTMDAVKVEAAAPEDKWAEFALRLSL